MNSTTETFDMLLAFVTGFHDQSVGSKADDVRGITSC